MKYKRKKRGGSGNDSNNNKAKLTSREHLILSLIAGGFYDDDIAKSLFVSLRTVNHHVEHIREKLDVKSRAHAVVKALRLGLLSFDGIEKTAEVYATKATTNATANAATNAT